jgi:hypothetical protein
VFDIYVWGRKVWPPPPNPETLVKNGNNHPPLDPDAIVVPRAEAPPASTRPGEDHKDAGPQTDEELSILGKINRMLLKMEPEARSRCTRWLAGRHGGL